MVATTYPPKPNHIPFIFGLFGLLLLGFSLTQAKTSGKPPAPKKTIAIVDDTTYSAQSTGDLLESFITGVIADPYITCQQLLAVMATGKRYTLYLIDYNPGEGGGLWGGTCTREILTVHPQAIVVGISADESVGPLFVQAGAKGFIARILDIPLFVKAVQTFLQ